MPANWLEEERRLTYDGREKLKALRESALARAAVASRTELADEG